MWVVCVSETCIHAHEASRGCWVLQSWSYKQLWTPVWVHVHLVHAGARGGQGTRTPGTGVMGRCELPNVVLRTEPGSSIRTIRIQDCNIWLQSCNLASSVSSATTLKVTKQKKKKFHMQLFHLFSRCHKRHRLILGHPTLQGGDGLSNCKHASEQQQAMSQWGWTGYPA